MKKQRVQHRTFLSRMAIFIALAVGSSSVCAADAKFWPNLLAAKLDPLNGAATSLGRLDKAPVARSTIVVFWASWCEFCKYELQMMQAFAKDPATAAVRVIGISVDEKSDAAKEAAVKLGVGFPLLHNPKEQLKNRAKIHKLPMTVVLTAKHEVDAIYTGITDERLKLIQKRAMALAKDSE